ncbi:MAG: SufD family Fe-S cluster assembly protein [Treponema sp.]|nr:SufD family Fe-S cluster assembly protein [Treponema sp.]
MATTTFNTTVNEIPALTWNWLKMNRVAFNETVQQENTVIPSYSSLPAGVTYSDTASFAASSSGMGTEVNAIFDTLHTPCTELTVAENTTVTEPVFLHCSLSDGQTSVYRQIIHAKENAQITVILDYTSEKNAGGFHAIQTKLIADKNAVIHLVKVQLLGSKFIHIDDTTGSCDDSAQIKITQIELGAQKSYVGVLNDLPGYTSQFTADTAYLCRNTQLLDMNYVVLHKGRKSDCKMQVKGTVQDTATKTYRGTIDFKKGCSGATGNEQEETLLLSPTVVNKSIPIILCDEEDVAGEHGASIGRLSDDVLFYMNNRGISKAAAQQMMSRAKIQSIANLIPDAETIQKINDYMDEEFGND